MQGVNNYPVIEPTDHDSGQDKRDLFAKHLTSFLRGWQRPFVISITSPWGTGKTFFLKRWQEELEAEGCHSIYFNAWASDYIDDPLDAFIGQIGELILELDKKGKGTKVLSKHWSKTKKYTKYFAKNIVPIAVARVAKTSVDSIQELIIEEDQGDVDNDESSIFDEIPKLAEAQASKVITDFLVHQETINYFKDNLSKFAQQLRRQSKDFPLVIIVDELDRCRPDFAITLIERIKHFFDVENIVFVLAMDQTALDAAVAHRYGEISSDENKQAYLAKFFDMRFILPVCDDLQYAIFLSHKYHVLDIIQFWGDISFFDSTIDSIFASCFSLMATRFELSMREQNKVFSFVCYVLRTTKINICDASFRRRLAASNLTSLQFFATFYLSFLFAGKNDLYYKITRGDRKGYSTIITRYPNLIHDSDHLPTILLRSFEDAFVSRLAEDNTYAEDDLSTSDFEILRPKQRYEILEDCIKYMFHPHIREKIDTLCSKIEFCASVSQGQGD